MMTFRSAMVSGNYYGSARWFYNLLIPGRDFPQVRKSCGTQQLPTGLSLGLKRRISMRNRLLTSAALLMASTALAAAQGASPGNATPSPSSPPSQAAPAEKMAPAEKSAPSTAKDAPRVRPSKATQSDKMAPKGGEMKKDTPASPKAPTLSLLPQPVTRRLALRDEERHRRA